MSTKKNVFVGVSGFSYAGWKGKFYPEGMKSEDFLKFYSEHLNSVEINSSFYAPPSAAMVKSWAAKTGNEFCFSFKAPRQITHILKLGKGSSEATGRLSETLGLLGQKRGTVLFQLPPYSRQDLGVLEKFLSDTSTVEKRVFEFRHESWLQSSTYQLLEKNSVGFCVAETEDMDPVFQVTGPLAYFRLRKESYSAKETDTWSEKIRDATKSVKDMYVYLRHDETGENALLAQRLFEKL